jgi:hypothetical protein
MTGRLNEHHAISVPIGVHSLEERGRRVVAAYSLEAGFSAHPNGGRKTAESLGNGARKPLEAQQRKSEIMALLSGRVRLSK